MDTETYIVMNKYKIVGYVEAHSTYHAIRQAEKLYGPSVVVERITNNCSAK